MRFFRLGRWPGYTTRGEPPTPLFILPVISSTRRGLCSPAPGPPLPSSSAGFPMGTAHKGHCGRPESRVGHPVKHMPDALRMILLKNLDNLVMELLDLFGSSPSPFYLARLINFIHRLRLHQSVMDFAELPFLLRRDMLAALHQPPRQHGVDKPPLPQRQRIPARQDVGGDPCAPGATAYRY